ncbi:MAG: SH3 domain-containing protein [Pirellulales bacterium]|nr:SH3 domain-containing protein [Pirellulales bacterium]
MRHKLFGQLSLCVPTMVLALSATLARGDRTFPYQAYVTADDVYVRSGPGQTYYPTDKLKAGQVVEVYRHDPGGWCAVRPPKDSFTWVSTRHLKPLGDGLAQVTTPRVAARVGSRFSTIRDVIQVRLHQDELVELLPDPSGRRDDSWVRIAPPSGEFRWINGKYLDPEYPVDGVRKNSDQDIRPPHESARPIEPGPDADDSRPRETRRDSAPRALSPEAYQKRLDDLDLGLSVMVTEEPTVWQFDEMALEAEHLVTQANTALERGRARMLLAKVERFENIKQRYDAVNHVVADTQRRDRPLAELASRYHTTRRTESSGRFDGRGRLTRVRSPKPGAPRYALVDETGKITCYVTPSPGMSLRHYEQRDVGVSGTRAYIPEQQAYHVMAKHIDVLGAGQLR